MNSLTWTLTRFTMWLFVIIAFLLVIPRLLSAPSFEGVAAGAALALIALPVTLSAVVQDAIRTYKIFFPTKETANNESAR